MTTQTTTMTDFLLDRIKEDEAVARQLLADDPAASRNDDWEFCRHESAGELVVTAGRVLAECEAKRRIVEIESSWLRAKHDAPFHTTAMHCGRWHIELGDGTELYDGDAEAFRAEWYEPVPPSDTLRALAAIYADHPDYRENEWRP